MSRRGKARKALRASVHEPVKHKTAQLKYLRVAPRKVRVVIDTIRGLNVDAALAILDFTRKAAAPPVARMLRAAVANAASAENVDVDALVIKDIRVDQGPMLKRFMPRAMGRATRIQKKSSHVYLVLGEKS
jgi:large subunit ribosomal protein L22